MKRLLGYGLEFIKRADMVLFALCLTCSIFGLVVISSATASYNTNRYVLVQGFSLIIGIGLFVLLTIIDIDIIADQWLILFAFEIGLLLILAVFGTGMEESGNKAWLRFFGIGIQPTEIVKVIFVVLLSKHATFLKNYRNISAPLSVIQLAAHFGILFLMIVVISEDLGSALIFLAIFLVILFAAGVKLYWFLLGLAAVAALTPLAWNYVLSDYQKDRILAPYLPDIIDPTNTGINFQPYQSKIALASGQLTGTGLYQGTQSQSSSLPQKHTDFIFAVIGEELGMIGCIVVIALLVAIMVRCVYIGLKSRNTMNMLICFGMAGFLFFQTFENIGMCIGIAPVIGLTLPFFSYGGSSLFATFAAMGIVSGIRFRPSPERFHSRT